MSTEPDLDDVDTDTGGGRFSNINAFENTDLSGKSITGIVTAILGLLVATWGERLTVIVQAITDLFIVPLRAFVDGIVGTSRNPGLLVEIYDSLTSIISTGASNTAGNLDFGILSLPIAFVIVFGVIWMIGWFLEQPWSSNLIPGSFTDIPFVGVEEEDED